MGWTSELGRRSEPEGMTLLHKSCWAGHLEMTQLLLDTGRFAQLLETKDKAGRTPLHLASFRAPEQVCRMLIAAGANPMTKEARGSMPSKATGGLRAESAKLVGENDTYLKAVLLASKVNQQLDLTIRQLRGQLRTATSRPQPRQPCRRAASPSGVRSVRALHLRLQRNGHRSS